MSWASHLLLDLDLEMAFQNFHQIILAAGIQHPVSDAALVPRHGINEDCKVKVDGGGTLKRGERKNSAAAKEEQVAAGPTCGLEVVALVGMFIKEDVVARHICGDPQRQVFQLRRLGAAQANLLLLGVDFLQVGYSEKTVVAVFEPCVELWGYLSLIINNSWTQVVLSASMCCCCCSCSVLKCQRYEKKIVEISCDKKNT